MHPDKFATSAMDFDGVVRLLLDHAPWRIALTLRGISIAPQQVWAALERRDYSSELSIEDLEPLLISGETYTLQLEYPHTPLPSILSKGRLSSMNTSATGIQVAFTLTEKDPDFDLLLADLAKRYRVGS